MIGRYSARHERSTLKGNGCCRQNHLTRGGVSLSSASLFRLLLLGTLLLACSRCIADAKTSTPSFGSHLAARVAAVDDFRQSALARPSASIVDVELRSDVPDGRIAATIAEVRFALPRKGTKARAGIITNESSTSFANQLLPTTKQTEDSFWLRTNDVSFILGNDQSGAFSGIELFTHANDHGVRLRLEFEAPSGDESVIVSGDLLQAPVEKANEDGTRLGKFRSEMAFTFGPRTLLAKYEDPDRSAEDNESLYKPLFDGIRDAITSYPGADGQEKANWQSLVRHAHGKLSQLTDLQLARLAIETSKEKVEQSKDWDHAVEALIASFLADVSGKHALTWRDEVSQAQYLLYSRRMNPGVVLYRFNTEGHCTGVVNVRMGKDTPEDAAWSEATKLLGLTEP